MSNAESTIALEVSDVSAQKMARVTAVAESTVAELVENMLVSLQLPRLDAQGRALSYGVRRQRDGLHLHASERLGAAVAPGDRLVLQPSVDAG